jgi:hypothetical protein
MTNRIVTTLADVTRAYIYLLAAGWRVIMRRQSVTTWLGEYVPGDAVTELTPAETDLIKSAARWINRAARRPFPWARCLQRSIALSMWLEHQGMKPVVRIGVRRDGKGIDAHAWVEYKGHIVNDTGAVRRVFAVMEQRKGRLLVQSNRQIEEKS